MKHLLKSALLITICFMVVSCSKTTCSETNTNEKGVILPNLEGTKWVGSLTSTGNNENLTFEFQKNNAMRISLQNFTFPDTIGTWKIQEFTVLAQFINRNGNTVKFKAGINSTELEGTLHYNTGVNLAYFNVKKQ